MKYLDLAAKIAQEGSGYKTYKLACVIKRSDGAIVSADNKCYRTIEPRYHAEARALRKADVGCTLFVVRISKSGEWACAKPCKNCQALIRNKGVKKVYYTIGPNEYGVWDVYKEKELD
jgi:tRNA(Arg) A34 adenosine deaminase TadA